MRRPGRAGAAPRARHCPLLGTDGARPGSPRAPASQREHGGGPLRRAAECQAAPVTGDDPRPPGKRPPRPRGVVRLPLDRAPSWGRKQSGLPDVWGRRGTSAHAPPLSPARRSARVGSSRRIPTPNVRVLNDTFPVSFSPSGQVRAPSYSWLSHFRSSELSGEEHRFAQRSPGGERARGSPSCVVALSPLLFPPPKSSATGRTDPFISVPLFVFFIFKLDPFIISWLRTQTDGIPTCSPARAGRSRLAGLAEGPAGRLPSYSRHLNKMF